MGRNIFFSLLLAIISTSVVAQTSVWKVVGNGNTLYIGGTVHVLKASDYPLPAEYDSAYAESDVIVFEADVKKMEDPKIANQMLAMGMYQDSTTIDKVLSEETFAMLKKELEKFNIPIEGALKMKPSMISIFLTAMQLQNIGMSEKGVDEHFYDRAIADEKSLGFLESVDSQLELMFGMSDGKEDEFIRYTIDEMEGMDEQLDVVLDDWRSGDMKATQELVDEMRSEFPKLTKSMLDDRNANWIPIIEDYMKTKEVEFVLFGNMHMVGDTGIVQLLKEKGYKVKSVRL